jgi:hypothetical protein
MIFNVVCGAPGPFGPHNLHDGMYILAPLFDAMINPAAPRHSKISPSPPFRATPHFLCCFECAAML